MGCTCQAKRRHPNTLHASRRWYPQQRTTCQLTTFQHDRAHPGHYNDWWVWSIANPTTSLIFHTPEFTQLYLEHPDAVFVPFHQCMYKLRPPDWSPTKSDVRVLKATLLFTNMICLSALSCHCDKQHTHVAMFGSARVQGAHVSRARAAGMYPQLLCDAWADIVHDVV